jgi:hypothetical protein
MLKLTQYYPRITRLTDGHFAWTVSPAITTSIVDSNMNIAFSFPVGMTHYVMIRGIRPFIRIQIHGTDWRTDRQFESYDSSGWVYHQEEQVLVLKLRHRTTVESIRIIYREAPPPPPPIPENEESVEAVTTGDAIVE